VDASAKDLRFHSKQILQAVARGEEVVITYHGKPCARMVPMAAEPVAKDYGTGKAFGMWKDNPSVSDVGAFVRKARKGRPLC
jgi:prevent-host-death family protein